jgi:hypothetical protein
MELKEILVVSGKSGLFKVVNQNRSGFIAESLLDHKRIPVYTSDKISNLAEISIYTDDKEMPLKDVFKTIYDKESGGKTIDSKSDEKLLKDYFAQVLPNYDREKVYVSHIKKILSWYNILHDSQMMDFSEEAEGKEEETKEDENVTAAPPDEQKTQDAPAADENEK